MEQFSTPMMRQYKGIKEQYKDCLVFYRMGDFYELFLEDAFIGAKILNITLTSKSGGKDGKIPMAGIPYHAVDNYLAKLVKAGYKVAICEQLSPPNKKGLVERGVVRVVTPGTLLEENALEKKDNNYIICLDIENDSIGLSFADLSTGYFGTQEITSEDLFQVLSNELAKLQPTECIISEILYNDPEILKILKLQKGMNIFSFGDWAFFAESAETLLKKHFQVATLSAFAIENDFLSLRTASILLGYLKQTQKSEVSHIKRILKVTPNDFVVMDQSSMINLELFSTIREHDPKGSLLYALDQTITPMGGRMLKTWLKKPLVVKDAIEKRHDSLSELLESSQLREAIGVHLQSVSDIERLLSRLSITIGNPRDVINLKHALLAVLETKSCISVIVSPLLNEIEHSISDDLATVISFIEKNIKPEPPIDLKIGGIIQDGVNKELDHLRKIVNGSRDWILTLEKSEREKTGITTLKIRFNKVFGFYIEISKANAHLAPPYYMRKQTLVNGERFITNELKHHEEIILTAEERITELEYILFMDMLQNEILLYTEKIQEAASAIGMLDCLLNFANLSEKNNYVRPKILYSGEIRITGGRHPVVEKLLDNSQFVPNDVTLDNISQQLILITGPNMAGKSVFIRQVALIVLMGQIGCFVPAQKAHISIVDKIFVRSGASDVITSGLSTFMVEMVETAYILNNATKNSLIVMDEIGRGTSTYDGISIAWAVAEYLVKHFKTPPKTLFATHYHELQALSEQYPKYIKNFHMAVADEKGVPIFLHTLLPGGASHSYGIAVAKLAGIPLPVIEKAQEILINLENRSVKKPTTIYHQVPYEITDTQIVDHLIHKELENIDVANMTPLVALNTLADLKEKLKLAMHAKRTIVDAD